jgi:hypothetical protein
MTSAYALRRAVVKPIAEKRSITPYLSEVRPGYYSFITKARGIEIRPLTKRDNAAIVSAPVNLAISTL